MGVNHEGAHARVFRGLDGERRVHQLRKRNEDFNDNLHRFIHVPSHNTNHNNIKMNIPEGFSSSVSTGSAAAPTPTRVLDKDYHNNVKWNVPEGYEPPKPTLSLANKQQVDDKDVETVYSVVYHTMSASFTGTPAGYVTESSQASPTNVAQAGAQTAASPAATSSKNSDESAYESAKAAAQGVPSSSSATSDSPVPTRQVVPQQHSSAAATTSAAAITSAYVGAAIQNTPAPSAVKGVPLQASATPQASSTGMSGGAKAGLAFGIIIALGLVAGLFFFCWRRRKNQNAGGEEINEKSYNEKSGFAATTAAKRLSADSDKSSVRSSNTPNTAPRLSLRPVTQFLPNLTSSNTQAAHEKPSTWERRPQAAQNPFGDAAVLSEKQANPFEEGDGSAGHERANSNGSEEPPTPKSAKFGTAAAVPVAKGPNNVHRVQLDFKPSMEDELELTSGQLVRMLHEYDDGWALCTRMDRTQQGVVPRTCLSKLAVKPRGPPQGGRPQSPNVRPPPPGANAPRPLTPTREQSPGFPKGAPARKPVPGQAL